MKASSSRLSAQSGSPARVRPTTADRNDLCAALVNAERALSAAQQRVTQVLMRADEVGLGAGVRHRLQPHIHGLAALEQALVRMQAELTV